MRRIFCAVGAAQLHGTCQLAVPYGGAGTGFYHVVIPNRTVGETHTDALRQAAVLHVLMIITKPSHCVSVMRLARGCGALLGPPSSPSIPEKGGRADAIPQQNQTPTCFFIPHHFHPRRLTPVPPSDTPDDAMSGEAGPAPGASTLAGANPRPAATVSLRTRGWYEGDGVGCPCHWIPRSEGRASEAHRQGANAVANIQTAGRIKRRG
ncbi:hypothetical protein SAMN05880561_10660 [Rhizobium sp. RU33A]|nr:hypothetical protein SAMN05880561_10660 [Rhizobium sp. RU33A]